MLKNRNPHPDHSKPLNQLISKLTDNKIINSPTITIGRITGKTRGASVHGGKMQSTWHNVSYHAKHITGASVANRGSMMTHHHCRLTFMRVNFVYNPLKYGENCTVTDWNALRTQRIKQYFVQALCCGPNQRERPVVNNWAFDVRASTEEHCVSHHTQQEKQHDVYGIAPVLKQTFLFNCQVHVLRIIVKLVEVIQ